MNDEAEKNIDDAANVLNKLEGAEPFKALALKLQGQVYIKKGDIAEGKKYMLRAIELFEAYKRHSKYRSGCYSDYGTIMLDLGYYDIALKYYLKAGAINQQLWGAKTMRHAIHFNMLGDTYRRMCDFEKAKEYLLKSAALCVELGKENDSLFAFIYNNLALAEWHLNNQSQAHQYWEKSKEVLLYYYPVNRGLLATVYGNLCGYYSRAGDFETAVRMMANSLDLTVQLFGENHLNTGISYIRHITLYKQMGDKSKGRYYAEKAIPIMGKYINTESVPIEVNKRMLEHLEWLGMTG